MKKSRQCPKCLGRKILHIEHAMSSPTAGPDGLVGFWGKKLAGAVLGLKMGAIEAVLCHSCGYMELYVRQPEKLEVDGLAIRELEGASESPYR